MAFLRGFHYSIPLITSLLSMPSLAVCSPHRSPDTASDIHDILPHYNIPKGVFPDVGNSYVLSKQDGTFTLQMQHPCYVKFDDQLVYYGKVIKGKLTYGKVSHVSGIQARMFFIWVSVTGMEMDAVSDTVEFRVGALSQKLPAKRFQDIPSCIDNNDQGCSTSSA